jgi:hypothetical protein
MTDLVCISELLHLSRQDLDHMLAISNAYFKNGSARTTATSQAVAATTMMADSE